MFINQIGMTVFGTVLAFATGSNLNLYLMTSIFAIVFYLSLLYSMSWEIGAKDKIRVESGRMPSKPMLGMFLSLSANIPNIILVFLFFVGYVFGVVMGQAWAGYLYLLVNGFLRLLMGMYTGTINYFLPETINYVDSEVYRGVEFGSILNPIMFLLAILPSVIICTLSYYLGLKEFRLSALFKLKTTK